MLRLIKILVISVWFTNELCYGQGFTIKNVHVKLVNDGFQVSLPDENGIKFVAFNVNVNRAFKNFEAGQYTGSVTKRSTDEWQFNVKRKLSDNDKVYVWLGVQHDNLIYRSRISPILIKNGIANYDASQGSSLTTTTTTTTTPTTPSIIPSVQLPDNNNCQPSVTVLPDNKQVCKNQIIFEDNFEILLFNNWNTEIRIPPEIDDSEFVVYNNSLLVEDGKLKITAKLYDNGDIYNTDINLGSRCSGKVYKKECSTEGRFLRILPPIVTGRLNTKNIFSFKYGRVEVRAKLPLGDWLYPLILLEPNHHEYNADHYDSGQMRIAFSRGNRNLNWYDSEIGASRLYGGGVFSEATDLRHRSLVSVLLKTISPRQHYFGDDFHTYSLTWTPEYLQLAVDGHEYGQMECNFKSIYHKPLWERGDKNAPLDKFFYITLGLAAGGHGDFPDGIREKPWQNKSPRATLKFWDERGNWYPTWSDPSLIVDYVRVYAI